MNTRVWALLLVLMTTILYSFILRTKVNTTTTKSKQNCRLPDDVIPQKYDLEIVTYLDPHFRFDGKVTIKVRISKFTILISFPFRIFPLVREYNTSTICNNHNETVVHTGIYLSLIHISEPTRPY